MGVIIQYEVSPTNPSVVGGIGTGLKYFGNNPTPAVLWNTSQPGINPPQDSRQTTGTPSATNASGQLPGTKLTGGRFRMYASGSASSVLTPTIQPAVQINTGTIQSPSYTFLLAPAASSALTANKPVTWSIAADLLFDPVNGTLLGSFKSGYAAVAGGTPGLTYNAEATLSNPINGLTVSPINSVGSSTWGPTFGFVVGIFFGISDPANSASLFEFKIAQD